MAERQSAHRQELERAVVRGGVTSQRLGQIFAFVIALAAIIGGVWLIAHDKSSEGLTSIITALAALVGVFVYGRRQQAKERERKAQANPPPVRHS